jgi:flagellar basal-body rod protein FlgB
MIGATEGVGTTMVKLALDAAALRHQAIAHNIANLDSQGYVPLDVSFEAQLEAVRRGQAPGIAPAIVQRPVAAGPRPQDADLEVAALAENTVHYQALLKALGVQLSILGDAIGAGGR